MEATISTSNNMVINIHDRIKSEIKKEEMKLLSLV